MAAPDAARIEAASRAVEDARVALLPLVDAALYMVLRDRAARRLPVPDGVRQADLLRLCGANLIEYAYRRDGTRSVAVLATGTATPWAGSAPRRSR